MCAWWLPPCFISTQLRYSELGSAQKYGTNFGMHATIGTIYDIACGGLRVCRHLVLFFRGIATQQTLLKYFRSAICDFMGSNYAPIVWNRLQRLLFGHNRRFLVDKSGQTQHARQDQNHTTKNGAHAFNVCVRSSNSTRYTRAYLRNIWKHWNIAKIENSSKACIDARYHSNLTVVQLFEYGHGMDSPLLVTKVSYLCKQCLTLKWESSKFKFLTLEKSMYIQYVHVGTTILFFGASKRWCFVVLCGTGTNSLGFF